MTDHTKYDKFVAVEGALNFSHNQLVKLIPYFFSRNNSKLVFISYIYITYVLYMCAFMSVSLVCCIYGAVSIFLCVVG